MIKLYFRNEKTTDTWLTPLKLIKNLGEFDLDPCAYPGHNTAKELSYLPIDGLTLQWKGRVWLNPPYGKASSIWLEKMAKHNHGTALVFARIDTKWFQTALQQATAVFFPKGRIKFERPDGSKSSSASAPSAFLAYGQNDAEKLKNSNMKGWFVYLNKKEI